MWRNLLRDLQHELSSMPRGDERRLLPAARFRSLDQLYELFMRLEKESAREVDNAIRRWCCNGMLTRPELSPLPAMMLRQRLEVGEQLLHLLMMRQSEAFNGLSVVPNVNLPLLARRILIDWWKDRGRDTGADLWVARQWNNLQEPSPSPQPLQLPPRRAVQPVVQTLSA